MPNAQFCQLGPFFSSGALVTSPKLYHYTAGTSSDKDIWSNRAESVTLAQPFVGDANGVFAFFGDGLYKLIVKDSADNTLYTWDNFLIQDLSAPSLAEGGSIASAQTTVLGDEVFAHITGTTNIEGFSGSIPFVWAVFDGALTLVHSSDLLLPGSVNCTVQSGDVCFFLNEGSDVWRLGGQMPNTLLVNRTDVSVVVSDARTDSVDAPLTITSTTSGTTAAGIGTGILFKAESQDENPANVGQVEFAFSDVGTGTEDSYFQILLRVAGAALTACYRFVATGAFKAIFTHANSADRTYTLQNSSDTIVMRDTTDTLTNKTLTSPVVTGNTLGTDAIKTATGSASGNTNGAANLSLNDYSFGANITQIIVSSAIQHLVPYQGSDSSTTVQRFGLAATGDASDTYVIRWRYFTASDNPTIWVARHTVTGLIHGVWASDDPLSDESAGIQVAGCLSIQFKAVDLEHLSALSVKASAAQDLIRDRKWKMQHQAFRALELVADKQCVSEWLYQNCDVAGGRLTMKR